MPGTPQYSSTVKVPVGWNFLEAIDVVKTLPKLITQEFCLFRSEALDSGGSGLKSETQIPVCTCKC